MSLLCRWRIYFLGECRWNKPCWCTLAIESLIKLTPCLWNRIWAFAESYGGNDQKQSSHLIFRSSRYGRNIPGLMVRIQGLIPTPSITTSPESLGESTILISLCFCICNRKVSTSSSVSAKAFDSAESHLTSHSQSPHLKSRAEISCPGNFKSCENAVEAKNVNPLWKA